MSNVENVSPQVLRVVARELQALVAAPPAGVKLLLRDDDLTDIVALIEGPAETPYWGGVFRVRVTVGPEYPGVAPRAYFLTRVFHPNVSASSGEVCVNTLRREWRPELGLAHALLALRCLLVAPNADSALNADAAKLLASDYNQYFARAKLLTEIHAKPQGDTAADNDAPQPKRERRAGGTATGEAGTTSGASAGTGSTVGMRAPRDRRRILKRL